MTTTVLIHGTRAGRRTVPAPVLGALGAGAFVVGTTELVIAGVLPLVAADLGVAVGAAGQLVTAYAVGICVGAPALCWVTSRWNRRRLLLVCLGTFAAGNVLAALAQTFVALLAVRFVTGALHGLFIAVASVLAATVVPPERRARAVAAVFGGVAVATVAGVPLGTWVSQFIGWRGTMQAVAVLAVVAWVATAMLAPSSPRRVTHRSSTMVAHMLAPRVLLMLAAGLLLMGGEFTAFTYVAVYLTEDVGVAAGAVGALLLAYGLAAAAGTWIGGRLADRSTAGTLLLGGFLLAGALIACAALVGWAPGVVLALMLWGFAGFALIPALQVRTMTLAGPAADLAAAFGASAVNAGIAVGAVIGGLVVAGAGARSTLLTGAAMVAAALPLVLLSTIRSHNR